MLNLIVAPKKVDAKAEHYAKRIVKYLKAEKVEYSVYFSLSLEDITANVNELTMFGETEFVVIGNDTWRNGRSGQCRQSDGYVLRCRISHERRRFVG